MNKVVLFLFLGGVLLISSCSSIAKEKLHGDYVGTCTIKFKANGNDSIITYPCHVLFYADVETPFIDLSTVNHTLVPSQLMVADFEFDTDEARFSIPQQENSEDWTYHGARNFSLQEGEIVFDGYLNEDNQLYFGFIASHDSLKASVNFNLTKKQIDYAE